MDLEVKQDTQEKILVDKSMLNHLLSQSSIARELEFKVMYVKKYCECGVQDCDKKLDEMNSREVQNPYELEEIKHDRMVYQGILDFFDKPY